jgi:hypothetical protein
MTKTAFILVAALAALPAMGETITFTISATGSGTLNGTAFSDETIAFTEVTDTSDISDTTAECAFGYPCAPDQASNTVKVGGVGYSITGATYFFDNSINVVGISFEPNQTYLSAEDGSVFNTYGLTTAFAPASYPVYTVGSADLATSGGALDLASFTGDATFSAVLGSPASSVPEPGSLGLALSGAILIAAGLLRRRKRVS